MTIGERIRERRQARGLTMEELGHKISATAAAVSRYELGQRNINIDTLQRIATALDVPFIELAGDNVLEVALGKNQNASLNLGEAVEQGVLALLRQIYGNVEEREVSNEYGATNYYLVGTGQNKFVIYDGDIETITSAMRAIIPPIIDRIKDIRPENDIISACVGEINSIQNTSPAPTE